MIQRDILRDKRTVPDEGLTKYEYRIGGGMRGAGYSKTIAKADGEQAVITVTACEWHDAKPTENKRTVDAAVLKDIESIFKKYDMEKWNHRYDFADIFVCDGPSYSYYFYFSNGDSVNFSSQIYPEPYRGILEEIDEAIKKYEI